MEENKDNKNSVPEPAEPESLVKSRSEANRHRYKPLAIFNGELGQVEDQKPSKWRTFFIILGVLQALGVTIFILIILWAVQLSNSGVSGTEFIGLYLFITLVPALIIIAMINLIGLPIYMAKHKPHGKGRIFTLLSLTISVLLALYGAFSTYQLLVTIPNLQNDLSRHSEGTSVQRGQQFTTDDAEPDATKEEAVSFMQNCKADYFVGYTDLSLVRDENTKAWLEQTEQTSSGVEILESASKNYIFVSKSMTVELQDTARQVRQACYSTKKLYITVDDWIETEYPVGQWTKVKQ